MSGLMSVKLRRDLRASWSRLALMVIAITISLTIFGGVLLAWSSIGRETSGAYMSTEPASATILLDDPIDAYQMMTIAAQARTRPGVIEATGRTQFTSEIEVNGEHRDTPIQVFVATPDDPMRMAKFDVRQEGAWPPAAGEIFVTRDSLDLAGMSVGDIITVETPSGEAKSLRVAKTAYDPSLAPAPQEQTGHAYVSTASIITSGPPALLDQLKIQVAEKGESTPSRDRDAIVAVASDVGAWLQREYGLAIREIQVPEPYEHPHQWQSDALLLSLLAGGAIALLLSAILVASMLNGLFTQQIPQIGIMKAIGARSGRIGRQYLMMTLIVAGAATALAIAPAIVIGRLGLEAFLGFLGVTATRLTAPWWAYMVVVAIGLVLPPLIALIPLVKTSRTTVRAAIDHHGASGATPSSAAGVFARLSRVRRLDRGLLMAMRNTVRRPARFVLSVSLLASAGMVFVAGMSLGAGVQAIADEQKEQTSWDVDVQLASPVPLDEVIPAVEQVTEVSRVEGWNRAQTGISGPGQIPLTRTYPDQGHGSVVVTAVPADARTLASPKLIEGRWLKPGETGAVVLNQMVRKNSAPDIHAGDTVQLILGGRTTSWRVVGIVEERGGSGGVYATAEGYSAALGQPQQVNQLRVVTASGDEQTRQSVANAVNDALGSAGIAVRSAASVSRSQAITGGHLDPLIMIVVVVAVAMGVVGGIGLASTMTANVLERTREFGIMHAIGAIPKAVRRVVVAEGVILALASCVVAVIPALLLTRVLGSGLGNLFMAAPLPYKVSTLAVGIWVVLVILGGALATDAAATRASRITVREALVYL